MRSVPRYNPVEDEFDLEHEINDYVDKTKRLIKEVHDVNYTDIQKRLILKAIATTIIDEI